MSDIVNQIRKLSADINDIPQTSKAILEKIRKWAVMGLTPKQLLEVIPYFRGWSFEKDIVPVQLDYIDRDFQKDFKKGVFLTSRGSTEESIYVYIYDREVKDDSWKVNVSPERAKIIEERDQEEKEAIETSYKILSRAYVHELPDKIKKGTYYATYLSRLTYSKRNTGFDSTSGDVYGFETVLYRGAIGFRIRLPNGKSFAHSEMQKIWWWLKDNSQMKDEAAEILGVSAHIPADQRTRENTGTCSICNMNMKLKIADPPVMVLHGFQRPGIGYVIGDCPGVGWPPYEISAAGCKNYKDTYLIPTLEGTEKYLADLNSGRIDSLHLKDSSRTILVHKGEHKWDKAYKMVIAQTEGQIQQLKSDIRIMEKRVSGWTPKPLP